jgi:hypothetical protein
MNKKIQPHYVNFNTAKLLKEKGFLDKNIYGEVRLSQSHFYDCKGNLYHIKDVFIKQDFNLKDCYNAPEQHIVVEWLRINHDIWVYTRTKALSGVIKFELEIEKFGEAGRWLTNDLKYFTSPQEAYSAAFDYVLKELI